MSKGIGAGISSRGGSKGFSLRKMLIVRSYPDIFISIRYERDW
jgi:hypothetical protein